MALTEFYIFQLNWLAACGGIYRAEQGQFSSPGYPVSYDHNLNCDYRIMGKPTDFIKLCYFSASLLCNASETLELFIFPFMENHYQVIFHDQFIQNLVCKKIFTLQHLWFD